MKVLTRNSVVMGNIWGITSVSKYMRLFSFVSLTIQCVRYIKSLYPNSPAIIERTFIGDVIKLLKEASLGNMMMKDVEKAISSDEIAMKNLPKLMLIFFIIWTYWPKEGLLPMYSMLRIQVNKMLIAATWYW